MHVSYLACILAILTCHPRHFPICCQSDPPCWSQWRLSLIVAGWACLARHKTSLRITHSYSYEMSATAISSTKHAINHAHHLHFAHKDHSWEDSFLFRQVHVVESFLFSASFRLLSRLGCTIPHRHLSTAQSTPMITHPLVNKSSCPVISTNVGTPWTETSVTSNRQIEHPQIVLKGKLVLMDLIPLSILTTGTRGQNFSNSDYTWIPACHTKIWSGSYLRHGGTHYHVQSKLAI